MGWVSDREWTFVLRHSCCRSFVAMVSGHNNCNEALAHSRKAFRLFKYVAGSMYVECDEMQQARDQNPRTLHVIVGRSSLRL